MRKWAPLGDDSCRTSLKSTRKKKTNYLKVLKSLEAEADCESRFVGVHIKRILVEKRTHSKSKPRETN